MERERGCVVWMTGLPSGGKTTLATMLEAELIGQGRRVERLDGDELRTHLTRGLGFSREDRDENVRREGWPAPSRATASSRSPRSSPPIATRGTMCGGARRTSSNYPGATEEVCVPILERESGGKFNREFFCGYSPEHVDPYYLTHKAREIGHHPEVILAGRRINDNMGAYVADQVIKLMTRKGIHVVGARILVMGLTFKENCPDLRNTKVVDTVRAFQSFNADVHVYDPWIDPNDAMDEYGLSASSHPPASGQYDAIVLAVVHRQFLEWVPERIRAFGKPRHVL